MGERRTMMGIPKGSPCLFVHSIMLQQHHITHNSRENGPAQKIADFHEDPLIWIPT
jgi:hypothetical protein